ncbi:hypothetical protein TNCV_4385421 [Trichonephila clavipes]|nr:hypothetical protein TNCV_4385421 [Trichonephila clavipes]
MRRNSNNLRSLNGTGLSRRRIFLSRNRRSCAAEQFHSVASLEAVDQQGPNNSENWQWTTESDVSARRSTPAPHGGIPGAIFQQDDARPHVSKTVRDFCSAQHMEPLPWPAYSPDMSPIEHVWDLVGRCLTRDPRPAASKDELLQRKQAIWNSLPQANIQIMFDSMPRRMAALIAASGGYTKY